MINILITNSDMSSFVFLQEALLLRLNKLIKSI
jgi:hypothetical protein